LADWSAQLSQRGYPEEILPMKKVGVIFFGSYFVTMLIFQPGPPLFVEQYVHISLQ
jgi:hypothetical protein